MRRLKIYMTEDPELIDIIHRSDTAGFVDLDGALYLNESDYVTFSGSSRLKCIEDCGIELDDAIFELDDREVDELLVALDNANSNDCISYLLDGRRIGMYVCLVRKYCIPDECTLSNLEIEDIFHAIYPILAYHVPSWIGLTPVTYYGMWDDVLSYPHYCSGSDVCVLSDLTIAKTWCDEIHDIYNERLNANIMRG